jgi:hypothetical protein
MAFVQERDESAPPFGPYPDSLAKGLGNSGNEGPASHSVAYTTRTMLLVGRRRYAVKPNWPAVKTR